MLRVILSATDKGFMFLQNTAVWVKKKIVKENSNKEKSAECDRDGDLEKCQEGANVFRQGAFLWGLSFCP